MIWDEIPQKLTTHFVWFSGYKQYTWWIYNYLEKVVGKVIPSYDTRAIWKKFPSKDNT